MLNHILCLRVFKTSHYSLNSSEICVDQIFNKLSTHFSHFLTIPLLRGNAKIIYTRPKFIMRHEESSYLFKILIRVFISKHYLVLNLHSIFVLSKQNNFLIVLHNSWNNISEQTHVIVLLYLVNFFREFGDYFIEFLFSLNDLSFDHVSFFSMLFLCFVNYVVYLFWPVVDFLYKCLQRLSQIMVNIHNKSEVSSPVSDQISNIALFHHQ